MLSSLRSPPKNQTKHQKLDLAPISFVQLNTSLGKPKFKTIKVLFDSGASTTVIKKSLVRKLHLRETDQETHFTTPGGSFTSALKCNINFIMPEFYTKCILEWDVHVVDTHNSARYDLIIGRNLLRELGIEFSFKHNTVTWDDAEIAMRHPDTEIEEINTYGNDDESKPVTDASNCIKHILDAKYEKANLDDYTNQCTNLNVEQRIQLNSTLKKFEDLFDGTLGKWKTRPYNIELKEDAKPFYKNPYPIPWIHEQTFKKELDRLCEVGVLEPKTDSEWGSPTFIIPKKDNSVRFITDFRELNKRIKCKPFPIPQIQDLLLKLEGFQYATSLDLNMGYYHIELSPDSQCLCTIVTPWGKYSYKRLPMGLCNSPDIFQEKISELMWGLEFRMHLHR